MNGLTPRQSQALRFIADYIADKGYSPSYREIADALGFKSKANVHWLLKKLAERGAVTYLPARSRSVCPTYNGDNRLEMDKR